MINNYILTAIFVILTINQSAAQSKKVQIEVLNTSLDSLNQSLAKEKILTKQLESQLSILAEILEKKETELITAKNSLLNSNIKTTELTHKLNLIRDSIEIYRNSIKKLTFTRDF